MVGVVTILMTFQPKIADLGRVHEIVAVFTVAGFGHSQLEALGGHC
jgi:hypothetical protein